MSCEINSCSFPKRAVGTILFPVGAPPLSPLRTRTLPSFKRLQLNLFPHTMPQPSFNLGKSRHFGHEPWKSVLENAAGTKRKPLGPTDRSHRNHRAFCTLRRLRGASADFYTFAAPQRSVHIEPCVRERIPLGSKFWSDAGAACHFLLIEAKPAILPPASHAAGGQARFFW